MGMTWDNGIDIVGVGIMVHAHTENALEQGAQIILDESTLLVPKEFGTLAASGRVKRNRGGLNTVGITYDGPYARYQHENLHFKHPQGGQAKYLETAMIVKRHEAINKVGDFIWDRVTSRAWGRL